MIPKRMPGAKEDFRVAVDAKDDGQFAAEASEDVDRFVSLWHRPFHATANAQKCPDRGGE